jgi:mannose-6-phosphate isomerase
MGTHPNNPSSLFDSPSTPLTKHLSENESLLGEAKKFPARYPGSKDKEFGGQGHVPFLFKILTCKQGTWPILLRRRLY